jgi:hypothetical protein
VAASCSGDTLVEVRRRGAGLLLAQCAAVDRLEAPSHPPARERLEHEVGRELAERLVAEIVAYSPRSLMKK